MNKLLLKKVCTCTRTLIATGALVLASSLASAEGDMMGTMPKAQPSAQPSSMKDDAVDTMKADHEKMKVEHAQMMKDHNKMMKKQAMAKPGDKPKMGTMKKMPMPMDDDMKQMDPMDADKTKKPADPMPADGMGHM